MLLTARDNAQVLGLLEYYRLDCKLIGHHFGKSKVIKVLGTGMRALKFIPLILSERPDLALSHGSRSQVLLTCLFRIPSVEIIDYEHANQLVPGIRPKWLIMPEVIPKSSVRKDRQHVLKYPGIKEDVYVPKFRPDPSIRQKLGLSEQDVLVTVRPPASDAHYHNPLSDRLFQAVIEFLGANADVRLVLLPRNKRQANSFRQAWPELFSSGKIRIPSHVVDGLNLIWFSDLVVSGGGTMNREAVTLGVPVYSIFRGRTGAVDRFLASEGRLMLLESVEDVRTKMRLVRRVPASLPDNNAKAALKTIVSHIVNILESECHPNSS